MGYTVVLVQPPGYIHSLAFLELGELLAYGLSDLGIDTTLCVNNIVPGTRPILIGCHLMPPDMMADMPKNSIVLNTEQVNARTGKSNENLLAWVKRFETWDYSSRNIEALAAETTMPVRHLRLGYHPALSRIQKAGQFDIDVLFYGSSSERRVQLVDRLRSTGMTVKAVFGIYGKERDELIGRSKIVLNMHNLPTEIFEIVRVFYLMTNRKAVVSEVNKGTDIDPTYRIGIAGASYDDIPAACIRLLENEAERRALEERAFTTISGLPQSELLRPLVESTA